MRQALKLFGPYYLFTECCNPVLPALLVSIVDSRMLMSSPHLECLLIDAIHTLPTASFVLSLCLYFLFRLSPEIFIDNLFLATNEELGNVLAVFLMSSAWQYYIALVPMPSQRYFCVLYRKKINL